MRWEIDEISLNDVELQCFCTAWPLHSVTVSLVHSNTQLCLHSSGCSSVGTAGCWNPAWRWWISLGLTGSNIYRGATSANVWNPLQPFSRGLSDPIHAITTKREPRGCAGQSVRSSRINDHRLRFSQCLTPHTYKTMRDKRQSQNRIW